MISNPIGDSRTDLFELLFKVASYGVALFGAMALFFSGGVGSLSLGLFCFALVLSWFLEDSKWQLGERTGVFLIFLIVPFFYLDWKFQLTGLSTREAFAGGNLSRLILILGGIKLLQKKSGRDWIFLYLISFFQILLAAGIGISYFFFVTLIFYLLFSFSAIILFEIRKTSRLKLNKIGSISSDNKINKSQLLKLPVTSIGLLAFIIVVAVPLFFSFPRVGGAGLGNSLNGLSGFTGFSDSVKLGEIGKLQQNDEIVMRIRVEQNSSAPQSSYFRWRGIALDNFENQTWRKSKMSVSEPFVKTERDFFLVDGTDDSGSLVTQTVYLEPLDTPILFALSRPVAVQGNFQIINKDAEGSLTTSRNGSERITYKVFSDISQPNISDLRKDDARYAPSAKRYLQIPSKVDERIPLLTEKIFQDSNAQNRYDKAKGVEKYLQTQFGYTLEMKAGGDDPLADFLFNIREGHCEYFASAMAIMLRTQGIATRVVNGFQQGEYNETADVFVVRQKDAHSWVEVYFPQERAWIPFDPTPSAGQFSPNTAETLTQRFNKLVEAVETFWIQYVVSYDNQEQRSLFRSIRNNLAEQKDSLSDAISKLREALENWWTNARGDRGTQESFKAIVKAVFYIIIFALAILLSIFLLKRAARSRVFERLRQLFARRQDDSVVVFYERMQKILEKKGITRQPHQTPLEFAFALNIPEAIEITKRYNSVRFGEKDLTRDEISEVENWLSKMEKNDKQ